jgi:hypothetical protein
MVQNVWLDNDIMHGTANIIMEIPAKECKNTTVTIYSFLRSVWIECLNIKESGDSVNLRYNIYANRTLICNNAL